MATRRLISSGSIRSEQWASCVEGGGGVLGVFGGVWGWFEGLLGLWLLWELRTGGTGYDGLHAFVW